MTIRDREQVLDTINVWLVLEKQQKKVLKTINYCEL